MPMSSFVFFSCFLSREWCLMPYCTTFFTSGQQKVPPAGGRWLTVFPFPLHAVRLTLDPHGKDFCVFLQITDLNGVHGVTPLVRYLQLFHGYPQTAYGKVFRPYS